MKKLVLLFTGLLIGLTTVSAAEKVSVIQGDDLNMTRYRYAQPILFVERGVEFLIFPDGSFDFNTNIEDLYEGDSYYKQSRSRRSSVNTTFGAPSRFVNYSTPRARGIRILHDRDGKVRRIGNLYLNYDRAGKIKRVGSVYMSYNSRNRSLSQVGGLRVKYNAWGEIIHIRGHVKPFAEACGICGANTCSENHLHTNFNTDWDSDWRDDGDFYYYKQNGKVKKHKKKNKKEIE